MFKNFLKISWRSIRKNKLYSVVNIAGLATGLSACILIGLYCWNELSYDKFNSNAGRIVRVTMEYSDAGTVNKTAVTGTKVGPQFRRTFPQVEAFTRIIRYPRVIANSTKVFDEKNVLYADADFFHLFSFKLLQGNPAAVLAEPYKIVLSQSAAKKYFGNDNPVGKSLRINDLQDYEVTGIVADAPLNSQVKYDMIASFSSLPVAKTEQWWSANYITYLLLHDGQQLSGFQQQLNQYMQTVNKQELLSQGNDYLAYNLEPLTRVHLYSPLDGLEPNGNITYIYVLLIIAALILLIACVNYTNLATAQSAGRTTEIGIRKVMGAQRGQLFRQFIGESFMLTLLAAVLSIGISMLVLPFFNSVAGQSFTGNMLLRPALLLGLLLLSLLVGLLAGSYPAILLSNAGLVSILKCGLRVSSAGGGLRKSLIVFQFVISVFLIISTVIVVKQISYIQHKNLGYNREQVLVLPVDYKMKAGYEGLKKAIAMNPGVVSVTGAYEDPTFIEWGDGIKANNGKETKSLSVTAIPVDLDFIKTMGMHLVAGDDFTAADFLLQDTAHDYANYRSAYILNETAARQMGWTPQTAVGQVIERGVPGTVKAVVQDFHFSSLHNKIGPLVMFLDTSMVRQMFVKISNRNIPATLKALENTWKERVAYRPFSYHFLDDDFNALYKQEQRTASLFELFSGLAITLACLGLFALAAFTTLQRTKEIGIRKVLGAGIGSIVLLITKEFLLLVLIAILVASPLAWIAGFKWLSDFAYRTNIGWWIFAGAGLLAILIALMTVSYHAIRASLANPVKSLRAE